MPKTQTQKNLKIETWSNPILNYKIVLHIKDALWPKFGQIFSQTRKLKHLTSFEPIFLNPKNSNWKNFAI